MQCDTFSRSTDAVFELSMRFAEQFRHDETLPVEEKIENERLMFHELSQSMLPDCLLSNFIYSLPPLSVCSLSLGQFH